MSERRVLVVGMNRFGKALVTTLWKAKAEVVVIDSDPEEVAEVKESCSAAFVGDVADPKVLAQIGAHEVDVAVICFGERFEPAVLCVAALRELGVKEIVARAVSDQKARVLRSVGATRVVSPDTEAGERLGLDLVARVANDLVEFAAEFRVIPWLAPEAMAGASVAELDLLQKHRVHVLGHRSRGAKQIELPRSDRKIAAGDTCCSRGPTTTSASSWKAARRERSASVSLVFGVALEPVVDLEASEAEQRRFVPRRESPVVGRDDRDLLVERESPCERLRREEHALAGAGLALGRSTGDDQTAVAALEAQHCDQTRPWQWEERHQPGLAGRALHRVGGNEVRACAPLLAVAADVGTRTRAGIARVREPEQARVDRVAALRMERELEVAQPTARRARC